MSDHKTTGRRLLFVHGAGGYVDDTPLARSLAAAVDASLSLPRLPDEDMSFDAWAASLRPLVASLGPADLLVAHSFGASILLRLLGEAAVPVSRATLLAMPDWSDKGWDVADYAYAAPPPTTAIALHHCRDDEVVPFAHLGLHAARLPAAHVHEHAVGGHQFVGRTAVLAAALS